MTSTERLASAHQNQLSNLLRSAVTVPPASNQVHSVACQTLPQAVKMYTLDDIQQTYILECNHKDHDSVRLFYGYEAKLKDGKLVRKM